MGKLYKLDYILPEMEIEAEAERTRVACHSSKT